MKKSFTISCLKAVSCFVVALFFAAACSDFDVEVTADNPRKPAPRSVFRSYDEALSLAEESIALVERGATRSGHSRRIVGPGQCVTVPATRGGAYRTDTLMYVFNFEDENGFSVIAANRAVDHVLAVGERGNYTYGEKTGVENFDFYMEAMSQGLMRIPPLKELDTVRTTPLFKRVNYDEHDSCDPLVPVEWGQQGFFGAYCTNGIAGCVATAIAQIMARYRYPTSITTTYTDAPHAGETIALDWDSMIGFPYTYQVSALLREIGQRVGMDYSSPTSSGAGLEFIKECFSSFGCACPTGFLRFMGSARTILAYRRPIFVVGDNAIPKKGGHAWVADGYIYSKVGTEHYEERLIDDGLTARYQYVLTYSDVVTTDLVHFNWGWSGICNGYFAPIISVSVSGYTFINLQMLDVWSPTNH